MLIAMQGVKRYVQFCTLREALCSFLYMESSSRLNAILGVKLFAHCYTWSKAVCSLLYME